MNKYILIFLTPLSIFQSVLFIGQGGSQDASQLSIHIACLSLNMADFITLFRRPCGENIRKIKLLNMKDENDEKVCVFAGQTEDISGRFGVEVIYLNSICMHGTHWNKNAYFFIRNESPETIK